MRTVRRGMVAAALAFPLAFGTAGMAAAATGSGEQTSHASYDATPDRDPGRSAGDEVKNGEGPESASCEDTGQEAPAWMPEALKNMFFGMGGDEKPGAAETSGKSADEGPDTKPNSSAGKSDENREASKPEAGQSRDDVPEEGRSATEHARDAEQEDCHHGTDKRDYGEDTTDDQARGESYSEDGENTDNATDTTDDQAPDQSYNEDNENTDNATDTTDDQAPDQSYNEDNENSEDGDRSGAAHGGDVTQSEPEYLD